MDRINNLFVITLQYPRSKDFGVGSGKVFLALVKAVVILNLSEFGSKSFEEYCRETLSLLNSWFSAVTDYE